MEVDVRLARSSHEVVSFVLVDMSARTRVVDRIELCRVLSVDNVGDSLDILVDEVGGRTPGDGCRGLEP